MKNLTITVIGRVQCVGFRFFATLKARQIGISGTVRNLPNGNVEIEVTANDTDLETFLDYLRVGPSMSRVTDILVTETDISYSDGFEAIF